jgi:hypothetical protein
MNEKMNRMLALARMITMVASSSERLQLFSIFDSFGRKAQNEPQRCCLADPQGKPQWLLLTGFSTLKLLQDLLWFFVKPEKGVYQVSRMGSSSPPLGLPLRPAVCFCNCQVNGCSYSSNGQIILIQGGPTSQSNR